MSLFSPVQSRPVILSSSAESQVYGLFAVAMALTVLGVYLGLQFASALLSSGIMLFLLLAELGIVFTSGIWMNRSPLNYILFVLFPVFSGLTLTPYILLVLTGYANGATILLNALGATTCMALTAALFARFTTWNLGVIGKALFFALLGFVGFALLQVFFPTLRGTGMETLFSGAGIVLFSVFTAYDIQRIQVQARLGVSPFQLALSLYLDIYNLFVMVLRFMLAMSGNRRN
jgi:FtsH-binding integral membrane protein